MAGPLVASSGGSAGAVFLVLLLIAAYFIPTIVGAIRSVPNIGSVVVVNVFLGWTFLGWVVALAMAARSVPKRTTVKRVLRQAPSDATPTAQERAPDQP